MFKRKEPKTPGEKATRALFAIIAKLGCCAYLIFIVVQLIKQSVGGVEGIPLPLVIIFAIVLGVAAVFFAVITLIEFFRGVKNDDYSMHKYYADDLAEKGLRMNEFGEYVPIDEADEEGSDKIVEEDDSEEYEDDDEYEYVDDDSEEYEDDDEYEYEDEDTEE